MGEKTGVNSSLGIAPKTEDFIKEAATSDMLEIEAAKIAQQKGDADEKKFAEQMIADHTKTSTELKGMVPTEMTPAIPTSLDDSSQKKLNKLRNAKPEDFASDYDPMQVSAHKDAVSLFERYAQGGDNAKLKGLARRCPRCSTICRWPNRWTRTASERVSRGPSVIEERAIRPGLERLNGRALGMILPTTVYRRYLVCGHTRISIENVRVMRL